MISPRQRTPSKDAISEISFTPSDAPAVSNFSFVAGTLDGIAQKISCFVFWAIKARMPSMPNTFAISWASATTVVTPYGSVILENSPGYVIELSMCIWISTRPGSMYLPFPSISRTPGYEIAGETQ